MRTITALLALGLLAACGRVGPPRPPGPADQITFPRTYPAPDRLPPTTTPAPPTQAAPAR